MLLSVSERKEVGEQERNGEMQTLEEEEGESEDKLVSPPPTSLLLSDSLSGLLCARLQIDSDVLIYVLMIGLVCSLCSAMLRQKAGSQRHTSMHGYSCTHTRQMIGLTLKFNVCIGKCAHVCFGERAAMTVHT